MQHTIKYFDSLPSIICHQTHRHDIYVFHIPFLFASRGAFVIKELTYSNKEVYEIEITFLPLSSTVNKEINLHNESFLHELLDTVDILFQWLHRMLPSIRQLQFQFSFILSFSNFAKKTAAIDPRSFKRMMNILTSGIMLYVHSKPSAKLYIFCGILTKTSFERLLSCMCFKVLV